jgi:hypothetical protein
MIDKEELADLKSGADDLEQGLIGLIALGGMQSDDGARYAIEQLHQAHVAIDGNRPADARDALLRGQSALECLIDQRGVYWRIVNVHQLPLFAYHVTLFFALIVAGITCTDCSRFAVVPRAVLGDTVPTVAVFAGGLGAELRAIWFLWQQTSTRIYHRRFLLSQLAAPFTGVLLGMLTYLVIKAGLLVIAAQGTSVDVSRATVGELAICFFVGFKWEWGLERIKSAFEGVGSRAGPPDGTELKKPRVPDTEKPEGSQAEEPQGQEPKKPEETKPPKPDAPQLDESEEKKANEGVVSLLP